jgi:hypothetical protein
LTQLCLAAFLVSVILAVAAAAAAAAALLDAFLVICCGCPAAQPQAFKFKGARYRRPSATALFGPTQTWQNLTAEINFR